MTSVVGLLSQTSSTASKLNTTEPPNGQAAYGFNVAPDDPVLSGLTYP
jgi:hypothetical protein